MIAIYGLNGNLHSQEAWVTVVTQVQIIAYEH